MKQMGQSVAGIAMGTGMASGTCVTGRRGFISQTARALVSRSSARFHGAMGLQQANASRCDAAVRADGEASAEQ